jgi:hypothetical protein
MEGIWNWITDWANNNLSDWTMTQVYIACAVAGGSVLIGQTGLTLFGLGDADDIDPDMDVDVAEGADSLHFLSLRALAGFLTFFGLVGWGGVASGWSTLVTVLSAFGAGCTVMLLVAVIMRTFARMHSEGNIHPEGAVGKNARVYLRIPAHKSGQGKVTVALQGRSMQFSAVTAGDELPTGSECRLDKMTTDDTFEVSPLK